MTIEDPTIYWAVLGAKALVLLLGAAVLYGMWRQACRTEQVLVHLIHTMGEPRPVAEAKPDDSVKQQLLTNLRLDKRLTELAEQVASLKTQTAKPATSAPRPLPIENATRMARHGASVEELTRTCGLNVGEAELLKKLYGQPTNRAAH